MARAEKFGDEEEKEGRGWILEGLRAECRFEFYSYVMGTHRGF